MSKLLTPTVAALILLAATASVQAQQSPSVATLPSQSVAPVPGEPTAVAPSPKYVGPAPGASDGSNGAAYQKPAGYDNDVSMHPYTAPGMGPKPH